AVSASACMPDFINLFSIVQPLQSGTANDPGPHYRSGNIRSNHDPHHNPAPVARIGPAEPLRIG
ncbi:hypothetical protein, partial [Blastomonas sp. CCH1-A6]|uniref:hypothetical protein n=1 Tax=Blastomonas sp. CCH1-A6 TaxID=1768762 RepID=UPI001E415E53